MFTRRAGIAKKTLQPHRIHQSPTTQTTTGPSARKTHNDGVFDAYTPEILRCCKSAVITGLPDAYGRGRIIGDYRRVALYGTDRLLEAKRAERAQADDMWPSDDVIRTREELSEIEQTVCAG